MTTVAPKKTIIVKLVTQVSHTLTIGETSIENVIQTGGWEGFIKLQTPEGDELIVEETDNIGNMQLCRVVKCSPALLNELPGKTEKK